MRRSATLAGAVALTLALTPAAQADPPVSGGPVCNQASPHFQGGGLVALDPATGSPAERYTDDLTPLPSDGKGKGLATAASHSPALTLCGDGGGPTGPGDGWN